MEVFFKYKDGKINYTDQGRGEVIVLLHGYLETSEIWASFAGKLAEEFRIIAVDLPGHGKSDIFSETHSMELIAGIIDDLIRSLDTKKFFLAGHSLGGYVTLAYAELFPAKLSGYCLFHSHPFADPPEVIEKREREINLVKAGRKDLIWPGNIAKMYATPNLEKLSAALKRSKTIASTIPGEGIIGVLKGMIARPSRLSVMEEGKIPCLWILGAMDNYINCEKVQEKVILPVNAKVVVLENSGHLGFIEEEEKSLAVLGSFIKGKA
jgi:pimeloyl-ACP methyl ester carboxylesterase